MNRVQRCVAMLLLIAFASTGCGGGGETVARIGGGGTGAPIEVGIGDVGGFGSIIVNGQHYEETGAQFAVDERPDQPTPASVDAVRVGMQMQFEHLSNRMTKATVASEVIGPVTSIGASSLVVLGQAVQVNSDPASPTISTALQPCLTSQAPLSKCTASAIQARRSMRRESSCEAARVCCALPGR